MNLDTQVYWISFILKLIIQWIALQVLLIVLLPFLQAVPFTFNIVQIMQNVRQDEYVYPMYFSFLNYAFVLAHGLTQFFKIVGKKYLRIKFIGKYYFYITSILIPILTIFLPIIGWFVFSFFYKGEL